MWVCLIWWMGCGLLNFIFDSVDWYVGLINLVNVSAGDGCGFVCFGLSGCVFFFFFF